MEAQPPIIDAREAGAAVDAVLERLFSLSRKRAESYGPDFVELWSEIERATVGGKRFRPRLVLTTYEALGGEDRTAAAYVAAAFELLHTALVVHDDVIDRDFQRRGVPNIAGRYRDRAVQRGAAASDAEHRGASAAVIAGDLALFNAYRLIDHSGVEDVLRGRLLEVMDEALFASAAGELMDLDMSLDSSAEVAEIVRMERYKTAVYSFECPLQAGALLAGAELRVVDALAEAGRELGVAYQIVDDLLGVFGSEVQTGKTTLGDLREGKRTALIAYAARTSAWADLQHLVGKPDLCEEEAAVARAALEACGARAFAEELVREHAVRADALLAHEWVPQSVRDAIRPLVEPMLDRVR